MLEIIDEGNTEIIFGSGFPQDQEYSQVSTYSRLLNQRDVKLINEELNITRHHSRLFLLHEFQTEEAFSQALREFFNTEIEGRKLLLLQFYFEEPKKSQQLLSCARHSVRRITKSLKTESAVDIVLLTRLPRISGGCGYIAMCGDSWTSLHLDELLPVKVFPADTSRLCKMTISEILRESFACVEDGQNGSTDGDHLDDGSKRRGMLVDTVFLLKQSMQKGIVQLRDKVHNTDRAKKRINILHDLLYTDDSVSHNFMKTLQRRIVHLLSAQEKATDPNQNWVICQALSDAFVVEGASFRHMLWIQMEDTVASALAQILAVVDGDNNLDHIALDQPSAKTELWLKVFQQDDLLSFPVIVKSKDAHVVFSTMEDREKTTTCSFPFSWVLKARFDKIWLNVIDLHGTALPKLPELKYVRKYEELINYPWVHDITKTNSLFDVYAEDLVKMSIPGSPCELNKIFSESLVQLAQSLYRGLTGDDPDNVSLIWLHVTYEYMRENHQIFLSLSQKYNDLMPAGRAKEASQAIKLILQELYPERILKDLDSCQKWLEMVKSLTTSVELIISQDTLVSMYGENGQELIKEIRLLWQSTRIVFLLMDHLLQETEMEEKLLKVVVRNFIFLHKKIQAEVGNMEKTFKLVTQVLKQCSTNACKVYLEGQTHCLYCKKEFSDENTAELSCGHMFCISCLEEDDSKKCRKCQKEIQTPYKKCEAVKRDTILKVNKFRRKCNSFFVEFVHNYYAGEGVQMTEGVVDMLMEYIGGNPSKQQIKATEESPLRECMNPNSTVQSLVLKILLRCRVEDMESHWQKFLEAVKSSKQNLEEFYFLVVRSTEDYIHTSARECILRKATESLCVDSLMSDSSDRTVTFKDLHTIAKLRFCLTVAADTIGSLFISGEKAHDDQKDFLQKLNEEAIVPKIDKFLIYGEMYDEVTDSSVKAIENPSYNFEMDNDGTNEKFPVCMTLAAVQQIVDGRASIDNESCLIAKIKEQSKTEKKWGKLSGICDKMTEDCLLKVSEELSLSHRPSLAHIVLHTAVVAHLSPLPEMQLLKALCFDPSKSKDCFIPTMPDMEYESLQTKSEKLWRCRCGEPVVLENCGMPWVEAECPRCKAKIGGQSHKPVKGFTQIDTQEDKQKGHILGDPSSRVSAECGRSLSGASLCLVRALIHSSMLWGAIDNAKDIETIVKGSTHGVGKHLSTHLLKDIELLAKVAGKNEEDAEMTIHLFLQHIIECSENIVSDSELKQDIHSTETRKNEMNGKMLSKNGRENSFWTLTRNCQMCMTIS
ncbi:hypothetical protein AGOR_G00127460 [Albula goreensis]|uniref:RING-type domain-containing protein n=1 Tax=Albula goreensis TaxID=1534307 RepID=A0A8T3DE71_9TELE|nr:hypothetical protein AGOR_G00127460 [Albula goreensis]